MFGDDTLSVLLEGWMTGAKGCFLSKDGSGRDYRTGSGTRLAGAMSNYRYVQYGMIVFVRIRQSTTENISSAAEYLQRDTTHGTGSGATEIAKAAKNSLATQYADIAGFSRPIGGICR